MSDKPACKAPAAGKFDYRELAGFFRRDVILSHRLQCEAYVRGAHMTINAARREINAMEDIADILDWLADREIEAIGAGLDDDFGGDN